MLAEQIFRDVAEIHSRLFDHRPVLQGHIKAFVREFEEKRGNREVDRLDKLHSTVIDMKDKSVEDTRTALDAFVTNVQAKLKVALEVCKKIEEKENNVEVGYLEVQRGRRREEWDVFMQQQFDRSAQVDTEMDEEMKKVSAEYAELDVKVERASSTSSS